jgi:hypothetical protein
MAVVPINAPPVAPETVEARFRRLASIWNAETGHLSSTTKIINHPAFQEIIGMGPAVIPFMLREMDERPRLWVWALPEITGVNPVSPGDGGNVAKMSQAWLHWAKEHGYAW